MGKIIERELFCEVINYSKSNSYSNYKKFGGYMLTKTLVVYSICSHPVYIS